MIPLKPDHAAAAYDFIRALPPCSRWGLPPADEVEFTIKHDPSIYGLYTRWLHDGVHIIVISSAVVGHTETLLASVAHEMVHLKQAKDRTETSGQHNAEWRRLAKTICRIHGFDPKAF